MKAAPRRRSLVAAALAVALWARVARGQAPPAPAQSPADTRARVLLDYAAPAELACPDRDTFASAIATRLGYDAVLADGPGLKTLHVQFSAEGKAVRVMLRLTSAAREVEAEKTLVSETGACGDLGGAAAFAAAILLDPRAMFPKPVKPAAPGASLDSNAAGTWPWYEPRGPIPPPPPPPPPPQVPWRWRVGVAAASCAGCAPATSLGGALFFGVARGPIGVDLAARADLPASTSADTGRSVSASLVLGELFPHARLGPARVGPLASLGSLFGESEGEKQASLFASVGLRAGIDLAVSGPVFLRAALDGALVLSQVSLRVGGRELWSTPAVTAGASLGGGVEF